MMSFHGTTLNRHEITFLNQIMNVICDSRMDREYFFHAAHKVLSCGLFGLEYPALKAQVVPETRPRRSSD